jgi:hypothetical protein
VLFGDVTSEACARLLQKDNIQVGYIVHAQVADLERRIKGFSKERRLITGKQT